MEVPIPDFALEVQVGSIPGQPGAIFESVMACQLRGGVVIPKNQDVYSMNYPCMINGVDFGLR